MRRTLTGTVLHRPSPKHHIRTESCKDKFFIRWINKLLCLSEDKGLRALKADSATVYPFTINLPHENYQRSLIWMESRLALAILRNPLAQQHKATDKIRAACEQSR